MTELLPHVEVETGSKPDATIIWLHGLGANGHDFEPIIEQLELPSSAAIRFVFPHAPSIPVTINNNLVMPAWYDILELSIERKVDYDHLLKSVGWINDFINNEMERGIRSERIIIAGFSQGGAVAFEVALSSHHTLAGLLALSTYFATKDTITFSTENKHIPIAIHHGTQDSVVPFNLAQNSTELLADKGYPVSLSQYTMDHAVCREQIRDIRQWFIDILDL
jgi:phospholipase/carboxylesterase